MDKILGSITLGTERIKNISASLRTFSRSDTETKIYADLHEGLDSTLMLLQHRLKGKGESPCIQVIKSYSPLPPVLCHLGQINQVFMNILTNAIDALEEAVVQNKRLGATPEVHITTHHANDQVVIQIADNGIGIPELIQQRLFEPLFTTKPVGKGTGLGLAIARQIVVEKHNGVLNATSQVGKGTEFVIELPLIATP